MTRAVEAVSVATQHAEKAEAKNEQPESISNEWVPQWVPQHESKIAGCLKEMVGERGFEPPTPWSRTWVLGANFIVTQSFEWCFDRLILAQSRQFWPNVNPRMATPNQGFIG